MSVGDCNLVALPTKTRRFHMLVPTKTGFLEIVREPQFKDIFTIQATDLDSIRVFRGNTKAKVVFHDYSRTFRFYGYAYAADISKALEMTFDPADIEILDRNLSPAPVGYRVLGVWHNREDDIRADVLAEELEDFELSTNFHFDEFRAWPLFHMTDQLVEQKNRAS
jgi:hypothetical protein